MYLIHPTTRWKETGCYLDNRVLTQQITWVAILADRIARGQSLDARVLAYSDYSCFLRQHGLCMHDVYKSRYEVDHKYSSMLYYGAASERTPRWWPTWLEGMVEAQRGYLMFLGSIDVLFKRIRTFIGPGKSIMEWLDMRYGIVSREEIDNCLLRDGHRHLSRKGVPRYANYYDQFGWSCNPVDSLWTPSSSVEVPVQREATAGVRT